MSTEKQNLTQHDALDQSHADAVSPSSVVVGQQPYPAASGAGYPQPPPGQGYGMPAGAAPQGMPPHVQQPQQQWMVRPEAIPGCPPGLEYLTQVDQILCHQQIDLLEVFINWEVTNKYILKNSVGQQVYFAAEESETCHRQCCGKNRGFIMHITDNMGQEVMRVNREFKCCAGCCWCANTECCSMVITIESPVGTLIGSVHQSQSPIEPRFRILDADEREVFFVEGPVCMCQGICCTDDIEFVVYTPDKAHEVGKISKQWGGFVREAFTNADNFGITFPLDLDVKMKATLVGALFLIDFMYFERRKRRRQY